MLPRGGRGWQETQGAGQGTIHVYGIRKPYAKQLCSFPSIDDFSDQVSLVRPLEDLCTKQKHFTSLGLNHREGLALSRAFIIGWSCKKFKKKITKNKSDRIGASYFPLA